jgi:hypothetical protein
MLIIGCLLLQWERYNAAATLAVQKCCTLYDGMHVPWGMPDPLHSSCAGESYEVLQWQSSYAGCKVSAGSAARA